MVKYSTKRPILNHCQVQPFGQSLAQNPQASTYHAIRNCGENTGAGTRHPLEKNVPSMGKLTDPQISKCCVHPTKQQSNGTRAHVHLMSNASEITPAVVDRFPKKTQFSDLFITCRIAPQVDDKTLRGTLE